MGVPKLMQEHCSDEKISQIETNCRQNQTESLTGVWTLRINDLHDQNKDLNDQKVNLKKFIKK